MIEQIRNLLIIRGPILNTEFPVPPGITSIGRQIDNDLVLGDSIVSRRHAVIQSNEYGLSITDLGSVHGVGINHNKIIPNLEVALIAGDLIQIGEHELEVESAIPTISKIIRAVPKQPSNTVPRFEAKVIIVGEGGVGKSSLLRAIRGQTFDYQLQTTHGIEIQTIEFPHPTDSDISIQLNMWDFGGQQIYHTTHQFFMTQRSLYILVWNARGDSEQGRLDHWLRHLATLVPQAPIILVATHLDERTANLNIERYKETYPQLVNWIGVSNKHGTGIKSLTELITIEASKLSLMGQLWPQNWLKIEKHILRDRQYHVSSYRFRTICEQYKVINSEEQSTLAGYLHDLGKILYFQDDDSLSDFVVLKPNWLTQTMARVLDDNETRDRNFGVLDHRQFARLWPPSEAKMKYERRLYPLFQRMLERFLISYQLENHENGHEQSLVPLLLPHAPPNNLPDWESLLLGQPEIRMLFKLDFVPPGIMSWFVVLTHHYSQNVHWREGVRLIYNGHQAEVTLNPSARELWLRVTGLAPSNFFNILQHTLNERIIRRYFTGLKYERKIPCNCHVKTGETIPCNQFFDYDELVTRMQNNRLQKECPRSYEMVSVPELLEGIHYTTNDRLERKIDEIHTIVAKSETLLLQNQQMSEQLMRDISRMWNLLTNNLSAEAPSAFLLMPGDRSRFHPRNLFDTDFTLYPLCQHPAGPHIVQGEKGYSVPHNQKWWAEVSPWLRELIKWLKYVPKGGDIVKAYDEQFYKDVELSVEIFKTAIDITPNLKENEPRQEMEPLGRLGKPMQAEGSALRTLHIFLHEVDTKQHWCNLRRVITNDGNILWLCEEHARFHGI